MSINHYSAGSIEYSLEVPAESSSPSSAPSSQPSSVVCVFDDTSQIYLTISFDMLSFANSHPQHPLKLRVSCHQAAHQNHFLHRIPLQISNRLTPVQRYVSFSNVELFHSTIMSPQKQYIWVDDFKMILTCTSMIFLFQPSTAPSENPSQTPSYVPSETLSSSPSHNPSSEVC